MTYQSVLHAIAEGQHIPILQKNPTLKDTLYAQHVIDSYRKGEIVDWHEPAPLEEIAFHLWNAWQSLKSKL